MNASQSNRRGVLAGLIALIGSAVFPRPALSAALTARATEGPFYPTPRLRLNDVDNDLVKVLGLVQQAGGEIITLHGHVTDTDGTPLSGHRVEIWQCDINGKYLHPGDDRDVAYDRGFQGFGHDVTDADGRYTFRTIKPSKYPGRTPHIHAKVFDEKGHELLTTQFYEAGNADNARDWLFRRMSPDQARAVSMTYFEGSDGEETIINIVL
ncbi:protocatechuate 3,4-dioxygenase [Nisaea sp.]|uniref:protocatechuate 3,4-dioxygenase n=1 Tax=Nisaea sp. TaxID=2024842 RepID=UPI0032670642